MGVLPKSFYEQTQDFSEPLQLTHVERFQAPKEFGEGGVRYLTTPRGEIKRYYRPCDFVIFPKHSPFDTIWNNNMNIHQRLGDKGFRDYIQELVNREKRERN